MSKRRALGAYLPCARHLACRGCSGGGGVAGRARLPAGGGEAAAAAAAASSAAAATAAAPLVPAAPRRISCHAICCCCGRLRSFCSRWLCRPAGSGGTDAQACAPHAHSSQCRLGRAAGGAAELERRVHCRTPPPRCSRGCAGDKGQQRPGLVTYSAAPVRGARIRSPMSMGAEAVLEVRAYLQLACAGPRRPRTMRAVGVQCAQVIAVR